MALGQLEKMCGVELGDLCIKVCLMDPLILYWSHRLLSMPYFHSDPPAVLLT